MVVQRAGLDQHSGERAVCGREDLRLMETSVSRQPRTRGGAVKTLCCPTTCGECVVESDEVAKFGIEGGRREDNV